MNACTKTVMALALVLVGCGRSEQSVADEPSAKPVLDSQGVRSPSEMAEPGLDSQGVQPPSELMDEIAAAAANGDMKGVERVALFYANVWPCANTSDLVMSVEELMPASRMDLLHLEVRMEKTRFHCVDCSPLDYAFGYGVPMGNLDRASILSLCDIDKSHTCIW